MGNSTKELVNVFNLNNYFSDKINTNFIVEDKKIFGLFASSTNIGEYLQGLREEIIKRHYGTEEVAGKYYNLNYFPFVKSGEEKYIDKNVKKVKLADSTNNEVIRNLKLHFAREFQQYVETRVIGDLEEKMRMPKEEALKCVERSVPLEKTDRSTPYLYCISFSDRYFNRYPPRLFEIFRDKYITAFDLKLEEYGFNDSSIFYEYKDNKLYIKDITNIDVIKGMVKHVRTQIALDFKTPGKEDSKVGNFKGILGDWIYKSTGKSIHGYDYDIFTDTKKINSGNSFALIPLIRADDGQFETLSSNDASKINGVFNNFISNITGKTIRTQFANCKEPVYAFSNKQIARLLPIIMESPIAYNERNGCFEFAVDLENFKRRGSSRSSSTVTSPFNSPTHAGPSGLRTPPNQRKKDTDSGYDSNSPPKPKDSGSSSGGPGQSTELSSMEWESSTHFQNGSIPGLSNKYLSPDKEAGPSTELSGMEWESPTRKDQDGTLKESPRQGLIGAHSGLVSVDQVDVSGTSGGFLPRSHLSSSVTNPHSSKCVSAAQNVPAAWTQNPWSSPPPAHENNWPSPAPSAGLWSWPQSGPSSWSSPPPAHENKWTSSLPFTKQGPSGLSWKGTSKRRTSDKPLNEKEKELIEALLYTLNLMNYTLDGVYTNFFAKDGKIVSLLHDNVDREEYLQAVIKCIIEEYYETEKEARKSCDFDEFPFKFLPDPDYEKNQNDCEPKKTVVANISSGALSNLKILFSQKFGKNVDAIDISAVKKVEKRKKDEWVDRQLFNKDSLEEACEGCFSDEEAIEEACQDCFPDKGAMKIIPIAFEGGEYVLDRSRDTCEVNLLFKEQLRRFRGTSLEKRKFSDKPLTEEEEKLFKALLYWFNSNNYALDPPHTNCILEEDGKIASLIDDSVNVKEYLQEVIDKTKEEYRVNKKEAYDLNEFPFKFLSNCEKNQETTVVANISRGALLNLKELFSQEHEGEVEIKDIDINIVKEAVKSKKDEWVNFKVRERGLPPKVAIEFCYPGESALEYISIKKGKGGYWIDRNYDASEVKSFREERWPAKGKSVAGKMKSEDNKDSGYSSGFVTDAENVSSKAEATTSGYESMDCENTRGGSPKRTLKLSMGMEGLAISTDLDATKVEQHSPIKKFRSN